MRKPVLISIGIIIIIVYLIYWNTTKPSLDKTQPEMLNKVSQNGLPSDTEEQVEPPQTKKPLNDGLVEQILSDNRELFGKIIDNPDSYEVQILFTEINKDINGKPIFNSHGYRIDPKAYFYPASSVKLAACVLALDKLNNLDIQGLNRNSKMSINKDYTWQTAENGSIAQYIQRILNYSDNNSYNRLYEFLGNQYFNETLWSKGYINSQITHRLEVPLTDERNRYTNSMSFYDSEQKVYSQSTQYNSKQYTLKDKDLYSINRGNAHIAGNKKINGPMDFSTKNYMSIEVLQGIMKAIIFPDEVPENQQFNLTQDDRQFLMSNMKGNGDGTYKYFICGCNEKVPQEIEIYNKIGIGYGNLVDNAYIKTSTGVEFLLTAVIYVNSDGVIADDKYDYWNIGMPFLKNLGKAVLEYSERKPSVMQ